jgi:hypothetical protein
MIDLPRWKKVETAPSSCLCFDAKLDFRGGNNHEVDCHRSEEYPNDTLAAEYLRHSARSGISGWQNAPITISVEC